MAVFGYPNTLFAWMKVYGGPSHWVTWWPTNGAIRSCWGRVIARETEQIAFWGELTGAVRIDKSTRALDPLKYSKLRDRKISDVWRDAAPGLGFNSHLRKHPNEKPLSLMERVILLMGDGIVLDPYVGSGTTLEAAKRLNRCAIGIEIEERYCEIAAKRLEQEVLPLEVTA